MSEDGMVPVLGSYKFTHPRRGQAIIINERNFNYERTGQKDRDGTDVDAEALESLFVKMGFDVTRHDNLTATDLSITMRQAARDDHSDADCFVCVILSHGKEGVVFGTDGTVRLESIIKNFKGDECPSLLMKPKLFFIQACRGTKFDWGVEAANLDHVDAAGYVENALIRKVPVEADVFVGYSVAPGYFSWRNNQDGSWYVQAMSTVFRHHHDTMPLLDMMTLVQQRVAYDFSSCTDEEFTDNMKQMPCFVSTLTNRVIFTPKY